MSEQTRPLMPGAEVIKPPVVEQWAQIDTVASCNCPACRPQQTQRVQPPAPAVFSWDEPPSLQANPNAGRIRGRYNFSRANMRSGLDGPVRWRQPGTLCVHDENGARQWTYTQELADGSLSDNAGCRWYPTEV